MRVSKLKINKIMKELKKCEVCGESFKNLVVHGRKHKEEGVPPKGTGTAPVLEGGIEEKMDAMIAGLNSVTGALVKLVDLQTVKSINPTSEQTALSITKETFTPKLEDDTYPTSYTPPRFRKICDEILSPEFGLSVTDFPDRTDFQLSISVPEKFSSVPPTERLQGVQDIRSRMIPRALGENGVKEWCGLIRKNLNRYYQKEGVVTPFNVTAQ